MFWFQRVRVGDTLAIKDDRVVPEYRGIVGIVTKVSKYGGISLLIIKGNKYHKRNGKLWEMPKDLFRRDKNDYV